eukprot:COSAG02_NODE_6762_length_3380_cov_2.135795_1_plen_244_part_00
MTVRNAVHERLKKVYSLTGLNMERNLGSKLEPPVKARIDRRVRWAKHRRPLGADADIGPKSRRRAHALQRGDAAASGEDDDTACHTVPLQRRDGPCRQLMLVGQQGAVHVAVNYTRHAARALSLRQRCEPLRVTCSRGHLVLWRASVHQQPSVAGAPQAVAGGLGVGGRAQQQHRPPAHTLRAAAEWRPHPPTQPTLMRQRETERGVKTNDAAPDHDASNALHAAGADAVFQPVISRSHREPG